MQTISSAIDHWNQLSGVSDSARLDTELLLGHVLRRSRESLLAWPEQQIGDDDFDCFQALMQRRRQHEPVAYITGSQAFWDVDLEVTPDVLIPRPETELLVEKALEIVSDRARPGSLADLGTGSGAIAIALARELPEAEISATDRSGDALAVARRNAQRCGTTSIRFLQGSWCDPLRPESQDIIVTNPPYIACDDPHLDSNELAFEPRLALVSGAQGFADIQLVIAQSATRLKQDGWLLLEHGFCQAEQTRTEMLAAGFTNVASHRDLAGLERVTLGQRVR